MKASSYATQHSHAAQSLSIPPAHATFLGAAQTLFPDRLAQAQFLAHLFESVIRLRPGAPLLHCKGRNRIDQVVEAAIPDYLKNNEHVRSLAETATALFKARQPLIFSHERALRFFSSALLIDGSISGQDGALGTFNSKEALSTLYLLGASKSEIAATFFHELLHSFQAITHSPEKGVLTIPHGEVVAYFGADKIIPSIHQMALDRVLTSLREVYPKELDQAFSEGLFAVEELRRYCLVVDAVNTTISQRDRLVATFFLQLTPIEDAHQISACLGTTIAELEIKLATQMDALTPESAPWNDPSTLGIIKRFFPNNSSWVLAPAYRDALFTLCKDTTPLEQSAVTLEKLKQALSVASLGNALEVLCFIGPRQLPNAEQLSVVCKVSDDLRALQESPWEADTSTIRPSSLIQTTVRALITQSITTSLRALQSLTRLTVNRVEIGSSPKTLGNTCHTMGFPYPSSGPIEEMSAKELGNVLHHYLSGLQSFPRRKTLIVSLTTPESLPYLDEALCQLQDKWERRTPVGQYLKAIKYLRSIRDKDYEMVKELGNVVLSHALNDEVLSQHSQRCIVRGCLNAMSYFPLTARSRLLSFIALNKVNEKNRLSIARTARFKQEEDNNTYVVFSDFHLPLSYWHEILKGLLTSTSLAVKDKETVQQLMGQTADYLIAQGTSLRDLAPFLLPEQTGLPWPYGTANENTYKHLKLSLDEYDSLLCLLHPQTNSWGPEKQSYFTALITKAVQAALTEPSNEGLDLRSREKLIGTLFSISSESRSIFAQVYPDVEADLRQLKEDNAALHYALTIQCTSLPVKQLSGALSFFMYRDLLPSTKYRLFEKTLEAVQQYSFVTVTTSVKELAHTQVSLSSPPEVIDDLLLLSSSMLRLCDPCRVSQEVLLKRERFLARAQDYFLASIARRPYSFGDLKEVFTLFEVTHHEHRTWLYGTAPEGAFKSLSFSETEKLLSLFQRKGPEVNEGRRSHLDALTCSAVHKAFEDDITWDKAYLLRNTLTLSPKAREVFALSYPGWMEGLEGQSDKTLGEQGSWIYMIDRQLKEDPYQKYKKILTEAVEYAMTSDKNAQSLLLSSLLRQCIQASAEGLLSSSTLPFIQIQVQWLTSNIERQVNRELNKEEAGQVLSDCMFVLKQLNHPLVYEKSHSYKQAVFSALCRLPASPEKQAIITQLGIFWRFKAWAVSARKRPLIAFRPQ